MKGIDLSNYALEDLLAFDDIFLDYFNNFLKNSAFPQQIQYNRYLGLFEEIEPTLDSIIITDRLPRNLNDLNLSNTSQNQNESKTSNLSNSSEQNRIFDWVRHERLPLFFRTDFFREFKLCKLLTRSLDGERPNSATSSQLIGGYSRQSPPISNSLSTDDPDGRTTIGAGILFASPSNNNLDEPSINSTNKLSNDFDELVKGLYNDNYDETDSNFHIDLPYLEKFNRALFQRPGSRALSVPSYFPFASMNQYAPGNLLPKTNQTSKKRVVTSKSTKSSFKSSTLNEMEDNNKKNMKKLKNLENLSKIEKEDNPISQITINKKSILKNSNTNNIQNIEENKDLDKSFYLKNNQEDDELDEEEEEEEKENIHNSNDYEQENDQEYFEDENMNENVSFVEDDDYVENEDYAENVHIHASINQYKMKFLGSVNGMKEFKEFLKNTAGFRLYKFWLDCEFYRDSMQDYDQIDNMATRNRLFRDINEKYVFAFAKKMHEKVSKNYFNNQGLNHSLFDLIQYDILRRLRVYWVPRFVLNKLKQKGKDYGSFPLPPLTPEYSRQSTYLNVPSISKFLPMTSNNQFKSENLNQNQKNVLYSKVKQALLADKDAGGPFLRYISTNCPENLPLILFWYDVCDFNNIETMGFDKNSRLQHAWAIYNSYLSSTARLNIGISSKISEEARNSLQLQSNLNENNFNNDLDRNLFQPVMEQIVPYLENSWCQFIKDDIMKYTEARLALKSNDDEDEEGDEVEIVDDDKTKLPEPEIIIENNKIYVKRSLNNLFKTNSQTKIEPKKKVLTEEEKLRRAERLKRIEIERKKALKAAAKRAKISKLSALEEEKTEDQSLKPNLNLINSSYLYSLTNSSSNLNNSKTRFKIDMKAADGSEKSEKRSGRKGANFNTDRTTFFEKMFSNKSMMQLFRKYFFDNGQKDLLNKFNVVVEAKQYLDQDDTQKKNSISNYIYKHYLDPNSKKNLLPLNDRLTQKLNDSGSSNRGAIRPKTPFMLCLIKEFRHILEDHFQKFCEQQALEHNIQSAEEFALMNQTELLVLLGSNYNSKDYDFDDEKGDGKSIPNKEDRAEFSKLLYEWSIGKSPEKLYAFYAHLNEHGKKDGMTFLDKDLLFCIDSIRIKEINGDDVLKQKAQVMIDVYLDSLLPPNIQIDIGHENHQKLFKSALKLTQGNYASSDLAVFDEIRALLFKDLVAYWAGFKRLQQQQQQQQQQQDGPYFLTKEEKLLKERLDEFLNMKNPSPSDFKLPPLSPPPMPGTPTNNSFNSKNLNATQHNQTLNIVFSIATGIKYKDDKALLNTGRNSVSNNSNERRNSNVLQLHAR